MNHSASCEVKAPHVQWYTYTGAHSHALSSAFCAHQLVSFMLPAYRTLQIRSTRFGLCMLSLFFAFDVFFLLFLMEMMKCIHSSTHFDMSSSTHTMKTEREKTYFHRFHVKLIHSRTDTHTHTHTERETERDTALHSVYAYTIDFEANDSNQSGMVVFSNYKPNIECSAR